MMEKSMEGLIVASAFIVIADVTLWGLVLWLKLKDLEKKLL